MKNSKKIIMVSFLLFTMFVTSMQKLPMAAAALNPVEANQITSVDELDLSKIKSDLEHQKEVFESYKKELFPNYKRGIDETNDEDLKNGDLTGNPELEKDEKIYKQKAAQKIINNIESKNSKLLPKLLELKEVMRKDKDLDELEVDFNNNLSSVVEAIIYRWANNPYRDSLGKALQVAAIKRFDLPYADTKRWKENKLSAYRSHIDTIGTILEEMKNETYKFLKSKGLKEVTLFRGIKSPEKMNENGVNVTKNAALSSWSILKDVSYGFSATANSKSHPYILVKNVPIDRILSFMETGLGTGYQYEFVVLSGMYPKDKAFILPGKRISIQEIAKDIARLVGNLDSSEDIDPSDPDATLQKAYRKYSKTISKQLNKIAEMHDLTANIIGEKLYFSLIEEKVDNSTARLISDDIQDQIGRLSQQ